jgi:LPS export ABC transporter protein LptC
MKHWLLPFGTMMMVLCLFAACEKRTEHMAPAINERDSASVMTSYGVNTLISDSGVMKYRIVAEKWEVNEVKNPPKWLFEKGLFLIQFDPTFHVEAYIQSDTAFYYTQKRLWELRSRVRVRTKDGVRFSSDELFWDQTSHELYSNKFSQLITPQREMQGTVFRSDESMRRYTVSNSKGSFVKSDVQSKGDTIVGAPDSVKAMTRSPVRSRPKTSTTP